MTTIAIKTPYSYHEDLSIKVDGVCNHAGAVEEVLDIQTAIDDTTPMSCLVCKCGAYCVGVTEMDEDGPYTHYDMEWQDE